MAGLTRRRLVVVVMVVVVMMGMMMGWRAKKSPGDVGRARGVEIGRAHV